MTSPTPSAKTIALIAHDNRKVQLVEWAEYNRESLRHHKLIATGPPAPCSPTRSASRSPA